MKCQCFKFFFRKKLGFESLKNKSEVQWTLVLALLRSCHQGVFLRKGVLKICCKFTGEHPCRSVISIKLLCNFIDIAIRHGCSPIDLLHIFKTPFPRNTSGWLLLSSKVQPLTGVFKFNHISYTTGWQTI